MFRSLLQSRQLQRGSAGPQTSRLSDGRSGAHWAGLSMASCAVRNGRYRRQGYRVAEGDLYQSGAEVTGQSGKQLQNDKHCIVNSDGILETRSRLET